MVDQDLDSHNYKNDLEIRKAFSKYIIDIELEIQKYGFHVAQSEILAFVLEKITGNNSRNVPESSLQNLTKREITANAEEISHYIVNRKFPFIEKFNRSDDKLNKIQLTIKRSRLGKLSENSSLRLFNFSNYVNSIFIIFALFLTIQSVYTLSFIMTSDLEIDQTFLNLDGNLPYFKILIYGYDQFWSPLTITLMGIFYLFNLLFSYTILNLPSLTRVIPNLNDHYNKFILKMKLNFVLAVSFISYMILGSVSVINNKRINGYEPIADLGIPLLINLIVAIVGGYILILLRKESTIDFDYDKPKLPTQLIILSTKVLVVLLNLLIFVYLGFVVRKDLEEFDGLRPNQDLISQELIVLNFVGLISFMFFFIVFAISSLLNHSRLKNNWYKFNLIQLIIQALFVLTYSALEYYIIITYNDYAATIDNIHEIPVSNLTQGMIRFYGSIVLSYVLLRLSK